jgi:hypothetical protein
MPASPKTHVDVMAMARAERADLADFLETLRPERFVVSLMH